MGDTLDWIDQNGEEPCDYDSMAEEFFSTWGCVICKREFDTEAGCKIHVRKKHGIAPNNFPSEGPVTYTQIVD